MRAWVGVWVCGCVCVCVCVCVRACFPLYFVVAAYEVDVARVLNLEGEQQANGLQGVRSSIHIVTQEQVVNIGDVPSSAWHAVLLKQPHEVSKLPMEISKELDRGCREAAVSLSQQ